MPSIGEPMKIALGSDHGGFETKQALAEEVRARGHEVVDYGVNGNESVDYPDYGAEVAGAVSRGDVDCGVLVCGTGIGMSIVANKFPGVRAALVTDEFMARMAAEHNNANVLVLGGRTSGPEGALTLLRAWLDTPFEGGRHQRRLDKIALIENNLRLGKE